MHRIAYLNNQYIKFDEAKIHIEDRGLQFSDSVYEVVLVINKQLIDFEFHTKRLKFSLNELSINYTVNEKKIQKIFKKLINYNSIINGIIYFQITRGVQEREHAFKKNLKPNIISYCQKKKFNLPNKNYRAYKAVTYPDIRWSRKDIKSTSLLPNILAAHYANTKGAYEAIFVKDNKVTESSHSNVWIIKNNKFLTHPTNRNILKGITRSVIKNIIKKENFKIEQKLFSLNKLLNADEVFITSSGSLITPIIKVNNKVIGNGKIGKLTKKFAILLYNHYKNQNR
mgnify:CR=1 FL=1